MKCITIFKCNGNIEVIDKSHCNLEAVPNLQGYSRSLEELFLDANKLTVLNDNLFRLTKLRRFSFSDNAVQDIPPHIAKLVNLVELDCSRNKILAIPEQIKFLRGLRFCDFSGNNIEYLPEGFSNLKNLTILTFNYCPIKILPEDFGQLKNLECLELRENELESLPTSLTSLENLRKLDLGRNLLKSLPDDIGRLTNLEYLLVDGNHLETVPPSVGELENLQCLDLGQQECGLKFLPEQIGGLRSLTDFHLSENSLTTLPDGIKHLKSLLIFKADNNFLLELNTSIGGCTSLQELVLTSNKLSVLPSTIGNLLDLRTLNVDSNLLTELVPEIGHLARLGILSLRDNFLSHLPPEVGLLDSLKVLDVSGNRLEFLPVDITSLNLKALWLSKNQSKPLPKLQIEEGKNGSRHLTCYLLPQQDDGDEELINHIRQDSDNPNRTAAVSFDDAAIVDEDFDDDAQFVRHNTPHPKELRARHQNLFGKGELKGHDNATFSLSDPKKSEQSENDYNNRFDNPHLSYESNGLPEAPVRSSISSQQPSTKSILKNAGLVVDEGRNYSKDEDDNNWDQILEIVVRRANGHKPGLGLSIAGGKDTPPFKDGDEGIFVSKVTPNGSSEAAGVKVGDKILAVNNNVFYEGITHHKAVEIFRKIKPDCSEFTLRILRDPNYVASDEDDLEELKSQQEANFNNKYMAQNKPPDSSPNGPSVFLRTYSMPIQSQSNGTNIASNLRQSLMSKTEALKSKSSASTLSAGLLENSMNKNIIYTTLVKDYKRDLGLMLENESETEMRANWSNIVITKIKPGSIASADGKLQVNDRILTINGVEVSGIDLNRVKDLLEGTDRFVRIVVSRGENNDPLGAALRNMPTRPPLGSWFASSANMTQRPSLTGSYRRTVFGSVNSLQSHSLFDHKKQMTSSSAAIPGLPPTQTHTRLVGLRSQDPPSQTSIPPAETSGSSMSKIEERCAWRQERLRSLERDLEIAQIVNEVRRQEGN